MTVCFRPFRDHCDAGDACDAVEVLLECRIPEVLRIMLLAGEETGIARLLIGRERQRKGYFHCRPVGPLRFTFEIEDLEVSNAGETKRFGIGGCAAAFKYEHRKALASREKVAQKIAERKQSRRMWHDQFRLTDVDQLDEKTRELHNVVVRPPRMPVSRADSKAGAPIEISLRIEITNGVDD